MRAGARRFGALAGAVLTLACAAATSQSGVVPTSETPAAALHGTWRLVRYVVWNADGKPTQELGESPSGYASFDATGHVFIQLMRPREPRTFGAYYGTYSVDSTAQTVKVTVEGTNILELVGTVQVRPFSIRDDTLVLGASGQYQATFIRVR